METITLQYSESIKEKLMNLLSKFSSADLEIVDEQYERIKKEAQEDYEYLESEDCVFYTQEELDDIMKNSSLSEYFETK